MQIKDSGETSGVLNADGNLMSDFFIKDLFFGDSVSMELASDLPYLDLFTLILNFFEDLSAIENYPLVGDWLAGGE